MNLAESTRVSLLFVMFFATLFGVSCQDKLITTHHNTCRVQRIGKLHTDCQEASLTQRVHCHLRGCTHKRSCRCFVSSLFGLGGCWPFLRCTCCRHSITATPSHSHSISRSSMGYCWHCCSCCRYNIIIVVTWLSEEKHVARVSNDTLGRASPHPFKLWTTALGRCWRFALWKIVQVWQC